MVKIGNGEVSGAYRAFIVAAPILSLISFVVTCFVNFLAGQDAEDLNWGKFSFHA